MGIFGKSSWLVIGGIMLVAGVLLRSGLIQWLLDLMGMLLIIAGIIVVIIGLIGLVTGRKSGSEGF